MIKQHDDFFRRSQAAQNAAMQMQNVQVARSIRKPLTDEQISAIVQSMSAYTWDIHMLARAVERAHGIGET